MPLLWRALINYIYKTILFPAIIKSLTLRYPSKLLLSRRSIISLSRLFISIGLIADETVLPRFGNLKATLQGSIFMSGTSWLSQLIDHRNRVTWKGALLLGAIMGLCELPMHAWILKYRS